MRKRRSNEKLKSHDNQLRRSRRMANIENIIKNNRIHQRRHKEQEKSTKKGNELNRKNTYEKDTITENQVHCTNSEKTDDKCMKNTERKTSVRDYMRKRRSNEKLKSRDSQIRSSHSMTNTEKTRENNRIRMLRLWPPPPRWALHELESLVFSFFWGGKRDLVARDVVVHHREDGGFGVVSTPFKVDALLVQWIRRLVCSPNSWVSLMTFRSFDRFGVDPYYVFSFPSLFPSHRLPPFYATLLKAWKAVGGCSSNGSLVVGILASNGLHL